MSRRSHGRRHRLLTSLNQVVWPRRGVVAKPAEELQRAQSPARDIDHALVGPGSSLVHFTQSTPIQASPVCMKITPTQFAHPSASGPISDVRGRTASVLSCGNSQAARAAGHHEGRSHSRAAQPPTHHEMLITIGDPCAPVHPLACERHGRNPGPTGEEANIDCNTLRPHALTAWLGHHNRRFSPQSQRRFSNFPRLIPNLSTGSEVRSRSTSLPGFGACESSSWYLCQP
jgi:hypothetical protein